MHLAIGLAIIIGLGIGGWQLLKWRETDQFNDGVCKCGGHFKPFEKKVQECIQALAFQCDACMKTLWITHATIIDYEYTESEISKRRKEKDQ